MSVSDNNCNKSVPKNKVVLEIDAFPFKGLHISEDWKKLDLLENRSNCSGCKKSRKYFCYSCYVAVPEVQKIVPIVELPVKVDIIKHAREMDGKSTAVHAAVLAPEDVRIFTYPCIPDYDPLENVVLVFPNNDAVSVQDICEQFFRNIRPPDNKRPCHNSRNSVVHRVVFIDSTWNQSRGIFKDPRIKALPSVVLKSRLSQFWRHQADSPRWYLATIEAIHQFMVELDEAQWHLDHKAACGNDINKAVGSCSQTESSDTSSRDVSKLQTSEVLTIKCSSDKLNEEVKPVDCAKTIPKNEIISDSNIEIIGHSNKCCYRESEKYSYSGKYDNLLFFFRFMYSKIHTLYDHDQLRSYKRRLE